MIPAKESRKQQSGRSRSQKPFMRGIMGFDDYSYRSFNHHIFVEDPQNPSEALQEIENRLDNISSMSHNNPNTILPKDLKLIDDSKGDY
jgi:hypothetical protein